MYSRLPQPRVRRTKRFSLTLSFACSPSFLFVCSPRSPFPSHGAPKAGGCSPPIFLTNAGSPAPAGLRSERSASIIYSDGRNGFFNPDERGRLVYLHRPAYRRHARAFGVHGERPVYDFGRVAVAAAVGAQRYLQSPQRYVCLPRQRPSLGIRLEPQWGHLMSCRQARCPAISIPFDALDWTNYTHSARLRNIHRRHICVRPPRRVRIFGEEERVPKTKNHRDPGDGIGRG